MSRRVLLLGLLLLGAGRAARAEEERYDLFRNAMDQIRERYVDEKLVASATLLNDALEGVVDGLDPESLIVDHGAPAGSAEIGLTLGVKDGAPEILDVVDGSPAAAAGLEPGGRLIRVNAESVLGKKRVEVDRVLRGAPGSAVSVLWQSPLGEYAEAALKRAVVARPGWRKVRLGPDLDLVQVFRFDRETVDRVVEAVGAAQRAGEPGLLLDVRRAAGGDPDAALAFADAFVPKGTPLAEGSGPGFRTARTYASPGTAPRLGGPVVALIGDETMGAAELAVGSLRDRHRVITVGKRTFGFCVRQRDFPLGGPGGRVLRLTVERFATPSHVSLTDTGVGADVETEDPRPSRTERLFARHRFVDRFVDRLLGSPPAAFDPAGLKAGELRLAPEARKGKSVVEQRQMFEQEVEIALEALVRELELDVPPEETDTARPDVLRETRIALAKRRMPPAAALAAVLREDPVVALGADTLRSLRKAGKPAAREDGS